MKKFSILLSLLFVSYSVFAEYKDSGNGILTDTKNSLSWQKCNSGADPKTCSGESKPFTWKKAKDYCSSLDLGGSKGWRLPTSDELRGLFSQIQATSEFASYDDRRYFWAEFSGLYGVVTKERTYFGYDENLSRTYNVRCVTSKLSDKKEDATKVVDDKDGKEGGDKAVDNRDGKEGGDKTVDNRDGKEGGDKAVDNRDGKEGGDKVTDDKNKKEPFVVDPSKRKQPIPVITPTKADEVAKDTKKKKEEAVVDNRDGKEGGDKVVDDKDGKEGGDKVVDDKDGKEGGDKVVDDKDGKEGGDKVVDDKDGKEGGDKTVDNRDGKEGGDTTDSCYNTDKSR